MSKSNKKTKEKVIKKNNSSKNIDKNEKIDNKEESKTINETLLNLLSILCPIIGIVFYIIYHKKNKNISKNILICTIIGIFIYGFVSISFFIDDNNVNNEINNQEDVNNEPTDEPIIEPVEEPTENNKEKIDPEMLAKEIDEWYADTMQNKYVVTVLGLTTCPHCQEYKPILKKLAKKYKFKAHFFELDTLENEDDYELLTMTYQLEDYGEYVPYTFITKNSKYIASHTGFSDEKEIIDFLKENNIIKN